MAIIGIDLGTTNSLAAVYKNGQCVLVPNSLGGFFTPSAVSVDDNGQVLVGQIAKDRLVTHPQQSAGGFKLFMGTKKTYNLGGQSFTPEALSAIVLRRLKEDAEVFLGEKVEEAVVSVPAYFNDAQRSATKLAGRLAGLKVDRIVNEPSAAALAYRQKYITDGTYVVIDLGGGTLDISVVEMFENIVDIIAVAGDNHLGGNEIDEAILNAFLAVNPALAESITQGERVSLLKMAEMCKMTLTRQPQAYMVYQKENENYAMPLDNSSLMNMCAPLLGRLRAAIASALRDAKLPISQVNDIILVGGSCRMPLIRQYVQHITGKTPQDGIDPDKTVAVGTGIVAGIKERNGDVRDMVLTDICPFTLGIRIRKGAGGPEQFSPIIPRNSALPASRMQEYQTIQDGQKTVSVEIYQGESMNVESNLYLGTVSMEVPPLPAGKAEVKVRFTYDINGILEVEVSCEQSGKSASKVIVGDNALTYDEIEKRVAALQNLKIAPREQDENRALIARGERLFEEYSGPMRENIAYALGQFVSIVEKGASPAQMAKLRQRLELLFESLDGFEDGLAVMDEDFDWENEDWDEEYTEE